MYLQGVKWVLPLLLFAGCWNDAPGLHLEVRAGATGATRVELYLATRACDGCDNTMRPKGVPEILDGEVWLLDGNKATKTPNTVADVQSGKVVFDLEPPGTTSVDVAYVIAVGYGPDGHVVGVAKVSGVTIPPDVAKFAKVTLDDAKELASSDQTSPEGNRVWVWRRPGDQASLAACVGLEIANGANLARFWFVPEDDTDCDGVVTGECDFYNFQAKGNASLSKASCVKPNTTEAAVAPNTCLVGGPACTDGVGPMACGPVLPYYCAPKDVCANAACRQDPTTCVLGGAMSHVKVTMPATVGGERCSATAASVAHVDLSVFVAAGGTTSMACKSMRFLDLDLGNFVVTSDFRPPGAVFTVGGPMANMPCDFALTWAQGAPENASNLAFIDLELENSTHVLVPMRLEIIPGPCDGTALPTSAALPALAETMANCALVAK